jgi:alkylhydroperoxidase family enzyme
VKAIAAVKLDEAKISASECELLRFTGKVNSQSFKITEGDVQHLRDLKWQEEQIAEAVHVAAMMGLCNRVANAFGLPSQMRLPI